MSLKVNLCILCLTVLCCSVSAKNITSYGCWGIDTGRTTNTPVEQVVKVDIVDRRINEISYDTFKEDTVITVGGTFEMWMGLSGLDKKFNEIHLSWFMQYNECMVYSENVYEKDERWEQVAHVGIYVELIICPNGVVHFKNHVHASSSMFYEGRAKSNIQKITVIV